MQTILHRIYGREKGETAFRRLQALLEACPVVPVDAREPFTAADAVLITYGDSLTEAGELPLQTLHRFAVARLQGLFSTIHILPFFPFSSDDGFSVTDFEAVRPDLGGWGEIRAMAADFRLMVDLVANHISAHSRWFRAYLAGTPGFEALAIPVDPATDLSAVVRPRALPLLTRFRTTAGEPVHLWTTFSADQVDLNYASLDVLEMMVRTLLFYLRQGARIIRLDAVAYLWKTPGTRCIHLPQTYDLVRLLRRVVDLAAPGTLLVTETNVPHGENISYFGNGSDQAHMVYNFTLPPLLLYCLATGRAHLFTRWLGQLKAPSAQTAFFNFTASHDGIGVRPLEGILSPAQIAWLAARCRQNGGLVSEKSNPDGSTSPYELNIAYLEALRDPRLAPDPHHLARFLASQAVALALPGVPGVYIHSLLGSGNWLAGVQCTGRARTINRARLSMVDLRQALTDGRSPRARVFEAYSHLLRVRSRQPAFHPAAPMRLLDLDDRLMTICREVPAQTLFALTNFSDQGLRVALPGIRGRTTVTNVLDGRRLAAGAIGLGPYETLWLTPQGAQAGPSPGVDGN